MKILDGPMWFEMAEKAVELLERVAAATERLADANEKMYEIERQKTL